MTNISKIFVLVLLLIMITSSPIIVESANAQQIPKPAVPQFSIQYVDYSYDIPAYNSTDAFTGKQIQHPTQHIVDVRIEGKIKNQLKSTVKEFDNGD